MKSTATVAESVARRLDRRTFLKKGAMGVFAIATGIAAQGIAMPRAKADGPCPNSSETASCDPPGGIYCTQWNSGYCNGAACAGGCSPWLGAYSGNGCWCTSISCNVSCNCWYYMCCDCSCPNGLCGCYYRYSESRPAC